jgi:hypothetical protein
MADQGGMRAVREAFCYLCLMPRLPIDTFHLIKRLQEAGFSPAQAEAQVEVLLELYALQETAKKKDVIKLRFLVKKDIALTQAKLRAELQEVEARRWRRASGGASGGRSFGRSFRR